MQIKWNDEWVKTEIKLKTGGGGWNMKRVSGMRFGKRKNPVESPVNPDFI